MASAVKRGKAERISALGSNVALRSIFAVRKPWPTGPHDTTLLYEDIAVGYFVYRNPTKDGWLRAIAPTFETHVNIPLNHSDWANPRSAVGTPTMVDLTTGANLFLGNRSILSLGVMTPVSGPRPVSLEAIALLNVFF